MRGTVQRYYYSHACTRARVLKRSAAVCVCVCVCVCVPLASSPACTPQSGPAGTRPSPAHAPWSGARRTPAPWLSLPPSDALLQVPVCGLACRRCRCRCRGKSRWVCRRIGVHGRCMGGAWARMGRHTRANATALQHCQSTGADGCTCVCVRWGASGPAVPHLTLCDLS
jgi:hypothetical protein